jgi:hypothetical protein
MVISITLSEAAVEKMNPGAPVTGRLSNYRLDAVNSLDVLIESERELQ